MANLDIKWATGMFPTQALRNATLGLHTKVYKLIEENKYGPFPPLNENISCLLEVLPLERTEVVEVLDIEMSIFAQCKQNFWIQIHQQSSRIQRLYGSQLQQTTLLTIGVGMEFGYWKEIKILEVIRSCRSQSLQLVE